MKNTIKYILLFLTAYYCHIPLLAQLINIDSLQNVITNAKEDSNKVNSLNALAMELRNNNPDTAIYYAKQALVVSEKIKFTKGIAEAYLWIGTIDINIGKYDDGLIMLQGAISKTNDKRIIADRKSVV